MFDRLDGPRCGTLAQVAARAAARVYHGGHEVRSTMVAAEVLRFATALMPGASDILVAAAWLMDIGHAETVKDTGFAALDAARFVRREGFTSIVAELIAHHTATEQEAAERGLADDLAAFPRPPEHWTDILTYANLCVGDRGEIRTPRTGIASLLADTGQPDPTRRALEAVAPSLIESAAAVEEHLARRPNPLAAPVPPATDTEHFVRAAALQLGWRITTDDNYGRWAVTSGDRTIAMLWQRPPLVDLHDVNAPNYARMFPADDDTASALILYPTSARRRSPASDDNAEALVAALVRNLAIYSAGCPVHGPTSR